MSAKNYRTEIPNIIDDLGLDPYERALYVHYKRVCGASNQAACTEGVRTTAEKTKISIGKVAPTRKKLIERGLIDGDIQQGKDTSITVVDIWGLNTFYYQQKERPNIQEWTIEQLALWVTNCSPGEQLEIESSQPEQVTPSNSSHDELLPINSSQPEQYCSPGEQKKEPIKKTTKKSLSKDKGGKPPKYQSTEKQKESRMMFSALANLCGFEIKLITDDTRGKLNQAEKKMRENGLTPKDVTDFSDWWYTNDWRGQKGQPPTLTQIRETWGQFIRRNQNGASHATSKNSTHKVANRSGPAPTFATGLGTATADELRQAGLNDAEIREYLAAQSP